MKSRIRTQKKSTREPTPEFLTGRSQPMFQSRSFVVQTQQAEKSQQQPEDLKTSLMRAERYGHHLSRIQPTDVSAPTAVQRKQGKGQQLESEKAKAPQALQTKENKTGIPDNLKTGIETLSGMSMNDVKVHYNSAKPAQLNAHAYTQGTDIHVGPGQEKHLAHEAWHTVQQKQGRVKPTVQVKGAEINDDAGLEKEADVMGEKALQQQGDSESL